MNWVQIYNCYTRTYEQSYRKIQDFIYKLELFDIQEFIEWKIIWKVIGYKEQLFEIENTIVEQGCIILRPIAWVRKPFMYEDDEDLDEYELKEDIKVEITDDNIWWYPKHLT